MNPKTIQEIKRNPLLHNYLRVNSYHYKYLYREDEYLKKVLELAKEYYKERTIDKLERLQSKINIIQTFIDVMN